MISVEITIDNARPEMSEKKKVIKVPEGKARFFKTRQLKPTDKGFVGYETVWEPFQKEVKYQKPKRP